MKILMSLCLMLCQGNLFIDEAVILYIANVFDCFFCIYGCLLNTECRIGALFFQDVYSGDFLEIEVIKDAENSRRLFFDDKTLPERCKEKGKIEDVHGNDSSLKICHQEYLTNPLKKLPSDSFHVVILSLVLSYLPTPRQRMDCCIKANRLLSENGLLLLIESDSAHQNRNCQQMVAWKMALESIGFARYRYQKLVHLQCMAFRKTACVDQLINQVELTHNYDVMFIPQDFHEEKCDFEQKNVTERTSDQNKEVCDIFSTLPHCI